MQFGYGIVLVEDDQLSVFHPHEQGEIADGGEEFSRFKAGGGEEEVHGQAQHLRDKTKVLYVLGSTLFVGVGLRMREGMF